MAKSAWRKSCPPNQIVRRLVYQRRFAFANGGVERVFQFRALELEFVQFLIGGVLDVFFDAADFVVEFVIFLEHRAELGVRQLERTDGFAMFGEFRHEGMMYVHWKSSG